MPARGRCLLVVDACSWSMPARGRCLLVVDACSCS
jgi:hypothetical protein